MEQILSGIAVAVVLLLHLGLILVIVSAERRQPSATLAWLLTVIFLPGIGVVLYLLIGETHSRRQVRRARTDTARIQALISTHGLDERIAQAAGGGIDPRTEGLLRLGRRVSGAPATEGNRVEPLFNAAATYRSMIEAVERARHHIHVLFYIIQPDATGAALRDRLVQRARSGIEVRVLYDAVGSLATKDRFWDPLRAAGGEVAVFNPVFRPLSRLRRRDRIDFRNHRKIFVVDGRIGFTGGVNVGREYLGLDPEMGHWRDTHMRIEGPAVLSLQEVFARDWLSATDGATTLDESGWFPEPAAPPGDCLVQIIDSGPDSEWAPVAQSYTQALAGARQRAWLTTPYFIPSPSIEEALVTAALRGADVRLLLPERADSLVVSLASRSYYRPLLEAGVRIFHYRRGFVHAKTMVVDSWVGTIGSANLDMRSFRLNFELNAFVFARSFTDALADQYLIDLRGAREITLQTAVDFPRRLMYQSARLLSPLL